MLELNFYDTNIKTYEGRDDSLLNDGLTLPIAYGKTPKGKEFEICLRAVGDIRGTYKDSEGNEFTIRNHNLTEIFDTNDEISEAASSGLLILDNNNWYDIEIRVGAYYCDPSDQDVVYSIGEGVEWVKEAFQDPQFLKYLDAEGMPDNDEDTEKAIVIHAATKLPKEDDETWSFPVEEIGYLLEEHNGEEFDYYGGRLYERKEA